MIYKNRGFYSYSGESVSFLLIINIIFLGQHNNQLESHSGHKRKRALWRKFMIAKGIFEAAAIFTQFMGVMRCLLDGKTYAMPPIYCYKTFIYPHMMHGFVPAHISQLSPLDYYSDLEGRRRKKKLCVIPVSLCEFGNQILFCIFASLHH